jgi:lipoprotein-anchoring transpeptidase ErfK/SrfK
MAASLGYTVQNDSEISLVLPTNPQVPSGQYYLYLVNNSGTSVSFPVTVSALPSANVPIISGLSGKSAVFTTGPNNYISGQYFTTVNSAYLASVSSPGKMAASLGFVVQDDSDINLTLPTNPQVPIGQYYLYLANSAGTSQSFTVTVANPGI